MSTQFFDLPPEIDLRQLFAGARTRDLQEIRRALGLPGGRERVLALSPDLAVHLLDGHDLGVAMVVDPELVSYGWELRERRR